MKRFLRTTLATAVLALAATPAVAQTPKFAYINSQKILAEAPGAVQAQKTFEQEMQGYRAEVNPLEKRLEGLQKELQTKMEALQTANADYEKQAATLTPAARQTREQELLRQQQVFEEQRDEYQQVLVEYQQKRQQIEQRAQERQQALVGPIMQQVSEVIEAIREEGSYAMIFDVAGGTMLVAADPALDLSDQVLARLKTPASGQ